MFGMIVVLGFFHVLEVFLTHEIPPANKDFIVSFCKTLENILIMVVSFWFGTNAGSKAKDETISDIAKAAPTGTGSGTTTIQNAESVTNATKEGDINVTQKEPNP
jgi:hypothetical protein